jgi:hypothetical protein
MRIACRNSCIHPIAREAVPAVSTGTSKAKSSYEE